MNKIALLLLVALGGLFWWWGQRDPFAHAPVGYIEQEPKQADSNMAPFDMRDYSLLGHVFHIAPKASYDISGRVLHTRRYFSEKYTGSLVTFDLGLGWKSMSDSTILSEYFRFDHWAETSGGRFLTWQYGFDGKGLPAGLGDFNQQLSNNHIIPADKKVFRQLSKVKAGDLIRLHGYLVEITDRERPEWKWITSTTRSDTSTHWGGNNTSCETIYVTSVERIISTHPYLAEPMPEAFWPLF